MNNSLVCIHQPEHLPWIGYVYKLINVDKFVLLDDVQYKKNHFSNRNQVRVNGTKKFTWLTVPVMNQNLLNKNMNEVEIDYSKNWQKKYLDTLYFNYKKTKYFEQYYSKIEKIILNKFGLISDLNIEIIKMYIDSFEIKVDLILSSDLNINAKKEEKLIKILENLQSENYFIGANGEHNRELFRKKGINIIKQKFEHPIYNQYHGDFFPNLSALDLLFNCGKESRKIIKGE